MLQVIPNSILNENFSFALICNAVSNLPISYAMYKDGVFLTNQSQYIVTNAQREQTGNYSCVASNRLLQDSSNVSVIVKCTFFAILLNLFST